MAHSGGADAAAGLRYQHLVTIEALLDAFEADPKGPWVIGVDLRGQDSADYIHLDEVGTAPSTAVQVKASMATSSTRLTRPEVISMLTALHNEHPDAAAYEIRTNRSLTGPAATVASALRQGTRVEGLPDHVARASAVTALTFDTTDSLAERLRERIGTYRGAVRAEVAGNVTQLVLSRLRDLVDEKATAAQGQNIDASMVEEILRLPGQQLAQASGGRQFGRRLGFPQSDVIGRAGVDGFLDAELATRASGLPQVAVVVGPSGSGKSSAVTSWINRHNERYYCAVWLSAGSDEGLSGQVPSILEALGESFDPSVAPSVALSEVLRRIPFPWLLVLDGVTSREAASKWIPRSGYGDVIITTQDATWPSSHARVFQIETFSDSETGELMRRRLGVAIHGAELSNREVSLLATTMARWPLAIDMACHWIARRGGQLRNLEAYLARIGEIDLDEAQSVPAGYSRTAVAAVRLTWEELSEQARIVLVLAMLAGAEDVPVDAVAAAGAALPASYDMAEFDVERVLDELVSSSLVVRFRRDSRDPGSPVQDRMAVHESLRLISDGRLAYPPGLLYVLNDALHTSMRQLRDDMHIRAAVSYVPAMMAVLQVAIAELEPAERLPFAPSLHNTGDVLMLTGSIERAAALFRHAAHVYAVCLGESESAHPTVMEYFLVSSARLATALLETDSHEDITSLVKTVIVVAQDHRIAVSGPVARAALETMSAIILGLDDEEADVRKRLDKLSFSLSADYLPPETAFAAWSAQLSEAAGGALALVRSERWGDAIDSFLIAANAAQQKGAMEYDVVETGIRVGAELLISKQARNLAQPPDLWGVAWRRFREWADALEDVAAHQSARLQILVAVVERNAVGADLRSAHQIVENHRGHPIDAEEVDFWAAQLSALERRPAWTSWLDDVDDEMLERSGVEVMRTSDGGGDVSVWLLIGPSGVPGVAFRNISATRNSGHGWEDPQPAIMAAAGFPRHDLGSGVAVAEGWIANLKRDDLQIVDRSGTVWLSVHLPDLEVPPLWISLARRSRYLHVIYGDAGGATWSDLAAFRLQAAVALRWRRWPIRIWH